MLKANGVKLLVDVRTVPKSRTNPQVRQQSTPSRITPHMPDSCRDRQAASKTPAAQVEAVHAHFV
jgi:hypothetical protein